MLLSVKVFAVCEQIANDFSNMSAAASFLFHPIASFISSQGSALEISDRKQIEMLNRAFDIRPHNIQYVKKGLYDVPVWENTPISIQIVICEKGQLLFPVPLLPEIPQNFQEFYWSWQLSTKYFVFCGFPTGSTSLEYL